MRSNQNHNLELVKVTLCVYSTYKTSRQSIKFLEEWGEMFILFPKFGQKKKSYKNQDNQRIFLKLINHVKINTKYSYLLPDDFPAVHSLKYL